MMTSVLGICLAAHVTSRKKRNLEGLNEGETINATVLLTSNSVRVANSARLPCFHGGTAAHTWKECMRVNVHIHGETAVT